MHRLKQGVYALNTIVIYVILVLTFLDTHLQSGVWPDSDTFR